MSVISSNKSTHCSERPSLAAWPLLILLRLYKILISPLIQSTFGPTCRYQPSCSDYAMDAIAKYGAWRGSMLAVKRLLRCHPWHDGGYDPVK